MSLIAGVSLGESKIVSFRVSEAEYEKMQHEADTLGLPLAAYARMYFLRGRRDERTRKLWEPLIDDLRKHDTLRRELRAILLDPREGY